MHTKRQNGFSKDVLEERHTDISFNDFGFVFNKATNLSPIYLFHVKLIKINESKWSACKQFFLNKIWFRFRSSVDFITTPFLVVKCNFWFGKQFFHSASFATF